MFILDAANFSLIEKKSDVGTEKDEGKQVCCIACRSKIALDSDLIEIEGSTQHSKINPAGQMFVFNCYSSAEGCSVEGAKIMEYSWFAGCAWQFAHCRNCGVQLGWRFSGQATFFALIRDYLIECH